MTIDSVEFSVELEDLLNELIAEMRANGVQYIQKMKSTSSHVQVCCPYHNQGMENRPSAGIRRSDGMFHCFACGEIHTLPEVISWCFGRDDGGVFGWQWLLKNFANFSVDNRKDIKLDFGRNTTSAPKKPEYVSEEELNKYRYYHPYWSQRKIESGWIIELFDLGYDPETDCITMPNRDINGNCIFVARRSVKTKYFNYPKDVKKPVYGLYELDKLIKAQETLEIKIGDHTYKMYDPGQYLSIYNEIIICESMIDALTCWEYGKPAVALNGLGTPQQMKELNDFPCRKYIIATDMDERGLQARETIKKSIKNSIVTEYKWNLKVAKDINDMEKPYFLGLREYY